MHDETLLLWKSTTDNFDQELENPPFQVREFNH